MADHAKPLLTSTYVNFLAEIMARVDDVAKGNNSGLTLSNLPVGAVRWNTSTSKWESNTGTVDVPVWTALTALYGIRVATADAFTTGRTIAVTGDATGTSAAFTGASNLSFAITFATVNANVGTHGSTTSVPVITVDGKGRITAVGSAALGSMATQSASNVAITGGTASLTQAVVTGSGHSYSTAGVSTQGNGATNTVFPAIGFHQPGMYGAVLQCRGGGSFYFYNLDSTALGTVYAATFSGALSGNASTSSSCSGNAATATTATKASTLAQNGGAGAAMTFNWSGQAGQPAWLWGGADGANMYVYNPSNFSVNYATSAGSCSGSSGSCTGNSATATTATNQSGGTINATSGALGGAAGAASFAMYSSSVLRGYLYGDAAGVGFLNNTGGWAAKVDYGTNNWVVGGNVSAYSDETVKTNWRSFGPDFITDLANLKSGIYDRTDIEMTQVGVGAQSLQKFMRHAVIEGADGKLSVAYGNAALASCVELAKEAVELRGVIATQQAMIDTLVARLDRLTE